MSTPSELGDGLATELAAALLVPHVERKRDVGFDPLDTSSAARDANPGLTKLAHGGRADAARGARDDRGLAREVHQRSLDGQARSRFNRMTFSDPSRE